MPGLNIPLLQIHRDLPNLRENPAKVTTTKKIHFKEPRRYAKPM